MTTSVFSLPVDIPWERLCASEDMIDRYICARDFPYRWRSSLAVFSYEPPEEDQQYPDQTVSYLKVSATITGFQPNPEEVGLTNRRVDSYWNDPKVINNYTDVVSQYYGCYGAILEVAVGPRGRPLTRSDLTHGLAVGAVTPADDYPYFADFEPKKRELYEQVTDTGETMSRSIDELNVRKGQTTTDGHELLDIFGGMSAQASYAGTGGGFGFSGQYGTRDMTQQEFANVRTSDQARELRETYSHTTQLTQMYHQLASYHLGTNRGVFFMLPRPHIVQSELTFVNGPRLLEGVQEIFLVVVRPKRMRDFCVEAYLETGHVVSEPQYTYETSTGTLTLHVEAHAEDTSGSLGDDSNTIYRETSETYQPPAGWEIDLDNNGGYKIESASGDRIEGDTVTEVTADHLTAWGKVSAYFEDNQWPVANQSYDGVLDMVVTIYIKKIQPDISGYDKNLWITGRGVCCCGDDRSRVRDWIRDSVNFEGRMKVDVPNKIGGAERMDVVHANAIRQEIGRRMIESVHHPDRYPRGLVSFPETKFMGRIVATLVRSDRHPDNVPVRRIKGLKQSIARKVARWAPDVSRGRLLQMSVHEQMDRFGLNEDEARELRRAAIGLAGDPPKGAARWEPPSGKHRPGPSKPRGRSSGRRGSSGRGRSPGSAQE